MVQGVKKTGQVTLRSVENIGDVASNLLFIPIVLWQNWVIIGIIALLGFGLVASRDLLIICCPVIAKFSVLIAALIDYYYNLFANTIILLIDAVKAIIDAVKFLEGKKPNSHFTKFKLIYISAEDVRRFFTDLPARCEDYTNIGYTLSEATKAQTNEILCPLVRITYPVPWMWKATNRLFGWGITNAVPQGTFIEDGYDGNCEFRDDPPDWLCITLSTGYIIVDIIFPALLVTILWPVTFGPLLKLAYREAAMAVEWLTSWFGANISLASTGSFRGTFRKKFQKYQKKYQQKSKDRAAVEEDL